MSATTADTGSDKERSTEAKLVDPILKTPGFHRTESRIAIAGHPIHAMLVAFPIALTMCTLGADAFYLWTGDPFWARAALWSSGMAFLFGLGAGLSGTVELLLVPGIRARAASWTHFVIAVMLLSILGANWGYRLGGYEQAVLPWGLTLSLFAAVFTGFTGWHGGKLVFDYQLGTSETGKG
ncbi:MAG: DUF2231 domain-containing protein [Methylobacterium mesophilicum]|nr:DUF2231 domain-containing protein [Methylobacterium mesophilicum]